VSVLAVAIVESEELRNDLCRLIRESHAQGDHRRISQIIEQLVEMFSNPSNPLHVKNGGLIGLAGTAIALGVEVAPYMNKFIEPLLVCFSDPENRIRYFSAECLYNIAKVSKGEILVYFNSIFDALSKVRAATLVIPGGDCSPLNHSLLQTQSCR
jgi:vacuole morphology and inheritance protein 14